ncbi:MAG: efflux RND transporter periplasmic adaptor subunit [Planctomycetia bacterium]|nr:efflux RND transporter periplasmic adaptor subunit [Planctomycetia bacterium]
MQIFSIGLTALLCGSFLGFFGTNSFYKKNLADEKFVSQVYESFKKKDDSAPQQRSAALVQVKTLEVGPAQEYRTILGRLIEINRSTVSCEVSGKIIEMCVEEGSPVEGYVWKDNRSPAENGKEERLPKETPPPKSVIARIDPIWNNIAVLEIQSNIAALEAKQRFQANELERSQALITTDAVSKSEFESNRAALEELHGQIAAQKALLSELRLRLKRSTIVAPYTGEVVQRYVDVGAYVTPGTPIAEVISTGQIDARVYIPEDFIQRIHIGQEITLHIDPLNKDVVGKVAQIVGSAETASRTFPVRVRLDDVKGELKAGMSVTSRIPVTDHFDALLTHEDAVLVKPDGNTIWVLSEVPEGLEANPYPVRILADMRQTLAIAPIDEAGRKALQSGVKVVTEGAERLIPGQLVQIVETPHQIQVVPGLYESGQQKKEED